MKTKKLFAGEYIITREDGEQFYAQRHDNEWKLFEAIEAQYTGEWWCTVDSLADCKYWAARIDLNS